MVIHNMRTVQIAIHNALCAAAVLCVAMAGYSTCATAQAAAPSTSASTATASATRPSTASSTKPVSTKLRAQYLASTDYRAFALDAMRRQQEGGYFYARMVTRYCTVTPILNQRFNLVKQDETRRDTTLNAKVAKAHQQLTAPCTAFAPDEADKMYQQLLANTVLRAQDPLQRATDALVDTGYGRPGERPKLELIATNHDVALKQARDNFNTLFALRDPILESETFLITVASSANTYADRSIWFDSKEYKGYSDKGGTTKYAIELMIMLAACSDDRSCGLYRSMQTGCLMLDQCFDTPAQWLREQLIRSRHGSGEEFDVALQLLPQIKQEVAKGNLSAFLPPAKR